VATPTALVQEKHRNPFDVGRAIHLIGFRPQEATPLLAGIRSKVENPSTVLREVLKWTGGQPFLTQKLCKIIQTSPFPITEGCEINQVAKLVQSHIIQDWEAQDEPPHLKPIRDRLLRDESRIGALLGCYQNILFQEPLSTNSIADLIELQLAGLIVQHQGKLWICNHIYAEIFNQNWVRQILAKHRPYAEDIFGWIDSNYQDNQCLLRGADLHYAQAWALENHLSDEDYRFLVASQWRDTQITLQAKKEATQVLAKAHQQARQTIRRGFFVLTITLGFAIGAVAVASKATQQLQQVEQHLRTTNQKIQSAEAKASQAEQRQQQTQRKLLATKTKLQQAEQNLTATTQAMQFAEAKATAAAQAQQQTDRQLFAT
jgi:hypothetical protein